VSCRSSMESRERAKPHFGHSAICWARNRTLTAVRATSGTEIARQPAVNRRATIEFWQNVKEHVRYCQCDTALLLATSRPDFEGVQPGLPQPWALRSLIPLACSVVCQTFVKGVSLFMTFSSIFLNFSSPTRSSSTSTRVGATRVEQIKPLLNSQWVDWRVKYGRQPGEANT
jgi:hypothetical protein